MKRCLLALLVAVVLSVAACSDNDDGDRFLLVLDGEAEVRDDETWQTLTAGRHQVGEGDELRITSGSGVLELPGDGSIELRAGDAAVDGSRLRVDAVPELLDGDALVVAGDALVELSAGRASLGLRQGAGRVRRTSSVTVALYRGTADIDAAGRDLPGGLPAYRQVTVPDTGTLPRRPVPLVYDAETPDPWDRRFIGEAIDLDEQLHVRARALERDLVPQVTARPSGLDAELLGRVLPPLAGEPGFGEELVDARRSVVETVVGASIVLGSDGDFVGRWRRAFDFRSEGADWGLVALDQEAQRATTLGVLDGAVSAAFAGLLSPAGPTTTTTTTAPPTTTTAPAAPGTTNPPPTTGMPPTTQPPPTTEPPPAVPPPTVPPGPLDPVNQLLDSLLGPNPPDERGLITRLADGLLGGR